MSGATLLICTVGGSVDPIVAALKHWQPASVRFVHSPGTRARVAEAVSKAVAEGVRLTSWQYETLELPDEQDFASCVERLRALTDEILGWARKGADHEVVVDFTGGTKCMTAALAIQARRWPCTFSYVGGKERTKEGLGTVVPGTESVLYSENPWNALGHQAVEDFIVLLDQHCYFAAAKAVEMAKQRVTDPSRKREMAALEHLARALDAWDRFAHVDAMRSLGHVSSSANDLCAALGQKRGRRMLDNVDRLKTHLEQLTASPPPSRHHVVDLLANAKRRREEGRFDDAVARLYRAIEALAQVALKERHDIVSTERVPLERVPELLKPTFESRARDQVVMLGLQDSYALLAAFDDPLGKKFEELELHRKESPLVARNRSILAHGFERVSESVFKQLWTRALALAAVDEASFPSFPALGETDA